MNIFILNTGRCESMTFIKACQHISNYTSAHESRSGLLGQTHFDYPDHHIEADNRLSWFLGKLDEKYGNDAIYVHLKRDKQKTAESFAKRHTYGIMLAYKKYILMKLPDNTHPVSVALDYCDTVNSNIKFFLKDKTKKIQFDLENYERDFPIFWEYIGAQGDFKAAMAEFSFSHNSSEIKEQWQQKTKEQPSLQKRILRKISKMILDKEKIT